jgi:hypothetical protein
MSYDVDVVEVSAVPFVYLERHGTRDQIGELAMPALDIVWTAVRAAAIETGHNVFVYRGTGPDDLHIQFGVQVLGAGSPPPADLETGKTPAGAAIHTKHVGTYDKLGDAFATLNAWAVRENRPLANVAWEVYGDWTEDPKQAETDCYCLLA